MSVSMEAKAAAAAASAAAAAVDAPGTSKRAFPCTVCDKLFSLRGDLKRHMRVHTGTKTRLFRPIQHLTYLLVGEKPFPCHICHTFFSRRSTLKSHLRTHTGEKPFVCGTCGKKYSQVRSITKRNNSVVSHHIYFSPAVLAD